MVDFDAGAVHQRDDGTWVYRASALGGCLRSLAYARMGMTPEPPPANMLARYDEGTDAEGEILERFQTMYPQWVVAQERETLSLYGDVVWNDKSENWQLEVEIDCTPRVKGSTKPEQRVVACHPDGIAIHRETGEAAVIEVKFLGPDFFDAYAKKGLGFKDQYAWQFAVEMHGTGLSGIYVVAEKVRDDDDNVTVGRVLVTHYAKGEEPYMRAGIIDRVGQVERAVEKAELPDCPTPFMFPCGYWQEHDGEEIEELDDSTLVVLVGSFIAESLIRDNASENIDATRKKIKERLGELGREKGRVVTGMGTAKVSTVAAKPGNVSWARWGKEVQRLHPEVNLPTELFRGKGTDATVRVEIEKETEAEG